MHLLDAFASSTVNYKIIICTSQEPNGTLPFNETHIEKYKDISLHFRRQPTGSLETGIDSWVHRAGSVDYPVRSVEGLKLCLGI